MKAESTRWGSRIFLVGLGALCFSTALFAAENGNGWRPGYDKVMM